MTRHPHADPHDDPNAGGGPGPDYLWDGVGTPDALTAHLERVLRPLAHKGTMPPVSGVRRGGRWRAWAVAAAVLVATASAVVYFAGGPTPRGPVSWRVVQGTGYEVERPGPVKMAEPGTTGQDIKVGEGGSVNLTASGGGSLTLGEGTIATMIDLGEQAQRIVLSRGSAYVDPDMKSQADIEVVTLAGVATVRPGTACLLSVEGESGRVVVKMGRVEVRGSGRFARVGAASAADLLPSGPGTPVRSGAEPLLRDLVGKLDAAVVSAAASKALPGVLAACGPGDEGTLWNLMHRFGEADRRRIVDRAGSLGKAVFSVGKERLVKLDPEAMEEWWGTFAR
jgi:hypothetical protein